MTDTLPVTAPLGTITVKAWPVAEIISAAEFVPVKITCWSSLVVLKFVPWIVNAEPTDVAAVLIELIVCGANTVTFLVATEFPTRTVN